MASPAIRAVRDDEIGACVSLLHDAFADVAAEFGLTRDNCPTNAAFIAAEVLEPDRERGCLQFAAEDEGMLTGFVELVPRPSGDLELRRLAVDPCERHVGLGHELVEFACRAAAELGASRITIGIIEENARLRRWYLAAGFTHTGTRRFPHLPFTVGYLERRIVPSPVATADDPTRV